MSPSSHYLGPTTPTLKFIGVVITKCGTLCIHIFIKISGADRMNFNYYLIINLGGTSTHERINNIKYLLAPRWRLRD